MNTCPLCNQPIVAGQAIACAEDGTIIHQDCMSWEERAPAPKGQQSPEQHPDKRDLRDADPVVGWWHNFSTKQIPGQSVQWTTTNCLLTIIALPIILCLLGMGGCGAGCASCMGAMGDPTSARGQRSFDEILAEQIAESNASSGPPPAVTSYVPQPDSYFQDPVGRQFKSHVPGKPGDALVRLEQATQGTVTKTVLMKLTIEARRGGVGWEEWVRFVKAISTIALGEGCHPASKLEELTPLFVAGDERALSDAHCY